jgi:GNAT superfamily N-acetyltransferase
MIRPATVADIPAVAALGQEFHRQAGWSDIFDYSADDCAASLETFLGLDSFIGLVAETDHVVGMAAGIVSPVYFNHGHLSGEELFWWVAADAPQGAGLRLLVALETEAKARGCDSWQMKSIAQLNGDRMAKLYERRGYRPSEHSFIKRL